MPQTRQLHFGAILEGVGTDQNGWRDPALPSDASINIDWYIENAKKAEASLFDLVFIVDSPYITPTPRPISSTGLNRSPCFRRWPRIPAGSVWWAR
jgi:hypothetical protein